MQKILKPVNTPNNTMSIYDLIVNNETRIAIGTFLSKVLVENNIIFISVWSFVHLFIGGLIYYVIDKSVKWKRKDKLLLLLIILIVYEVIEAFFYMNLTMLFIPETSLDVVWDLIIGMLGGFIASLFLKK